MTGASEDRVAIVTGGASGIGAATVRRLVADGLRVIAADIDEAGSTEIASETGCVASFVDVSDSGSVAACVEDAVHRFGRIDVLVNNAGVSLMGSVANLSAEEWDRGMGINLTSVFLMSRAAWPHLEESSGTIVNVSSVGGLWAIPGNPAYCAAKAGVIMLTKCMAIDGARAGVRVNCICPGFVLTPMSEGFYAAQRDPVAARHEAEHETPLGRLGTPEDIAATVAHLTSAGGAWMSGSIVTVDGGLTSGFWRG